MFISSLVIRRLSFDNVLFQTLKVVKWLLAILALEKRLACGGAELADYFGIL